jgi:histidinol-phosphate/aromatic aminotransferase/cobyric acid decarboxylase-like protein
LNGLTGQEVTERLFEDSRILINNCGSKNGLDGDFIRIACRTKEENNHLVEGLKRMTNLTEADETDAIRAR